MATQAPDTAHYGRSRSYTTNQSFARSESYQIQPTLLEQAELDETNGELRLVCTTFSRQTYEYGNPQFLNAVSAMGLPPVPYGSIKRKWRYSDRHTAQSTLPFIYLGPHTVARDAAWLDEHKITMVIAVRSARAAMASRKFLDPAHFKSCKNLATATFDVDSPYEVITRVKPIIKVMTDHLESQNIGRTPSSFNEVGGRILIICESGNERSPVLLAAWLMVVYGLAWSESMNLIHAFRFSVALNSGMNEMLNTLQMVLKAETDTANAQQSIESQTTQSQSTASRAQKRSVEDAYDTDDTMTDEMDMDTRPGIAPFLDKNSRQFSAVNNMET